MAKVVIIGPAHPLRGGLATFNQRLARAFNDAGHSCSIYSFSLQYPAFIFPGKTQYTDEPAPDGIDIHTVINSVNPLNWLKVGRRLRRERPDLILVRFWLPLMGPALGTILRQVKKKINTPASFVSQTMSSLMKKDRGIVRLPVTSSAVAMPLSP